MNSESLIDVYRAVTEADDYVRKTPVSGSMVGGCRRLAAYALTKGWPDQDAQEASWGPQAFLGSAIHDHLLPRLAQQMGGLHEVPVLAQMEGLEISGSVDLLLDDTVVDVKTASDDYFPVLCANIPINYRLQPTFYGMATGAKWCSLLIINRSSGKPHVETWPTSDYEFGVSAWLHDIQAELDLVERDERGPGLSIVCDHCPFVVDCWGVAPQGRLPQSIMASGSDAIAQALVEYNDARARESRAKADKEFWRAALVGADDGAYGKWQLSWRGSGRDTEVFDAEAAQQVLVDADLPVPMKVKRGSKTISVTPAPQT